MNLNAKIVWITGSGRGIGAATACALAARGARVVVSARRDDDIARVAAEINADGDSALAIQCDVQKNSDILQLVKQTQEVWGSIDILINNAGVATFKKILDTSEEEWDAMLNTNLKSAFLCTKAVLPDMIRRRSGKIINVVSVAGKQAYVNCGGYCASKFGLRGFTDVLRMEHRHHGIQVTSIIAGATSTDIWGDAADHSLMMTPEHVAQAIVSICEAGDSTHIEEIVLRPQGGDL
ncbi:SDR family oxidoreductase [candidate division KSB1 bacterium]|nr:SDR family oxidoreductase [candidate division KSB1 bacterium]RQW06797.1 MAG: SDR family oxidoreductase [candidate division KSB1 bacterium]